MYTTHVCRHCYRTLLNLRDKVFISEQMCHNAGESCQWKTENEKDSTLSEIKSFHLPSALTKKRGFNLAAMKALFIDEKENISPSPLNHKEESVHTSTDNISPIIQNSSRCRPLETPAQQRPVPENIWFNKCSID